LAEAAAMGTSPLDDDVVTEAEIYVLPEDHDVDVTELVDAPPETVKTPIDRLAEAFPGSELVEETHL
jgi:DNA polymerase-3 subunit gamma/tau